jgi:hypothetical protein
MKKIKLIICLLFVLISSCKMPVSNGYVIIHTNNKDLFIRHYFDENNQEHSRVYGSGKQNDSITFSRSNNDLLVTEFRYSEGQKKRIFGENVKYVNYYIKITDIKYSAGTGRINNILPIENLDFLKNDKEIENIIKENCAIEKNRHVFKDCNFILPKSNNLDYIPDNTRIISAEIIKNKNNLPYNISLNLKYFDTKIYYQRFYYYKGKQIFKIKTIISDSISTDNILDSYRKINL